MTKPDDEQLDVNEVIAEMRNLIGEQGQQIAMLRSALSKARRPSTDPTPAPEQVNHARTT